MIRNWGPFTRGESDHGLDEKIYFDAGESIKYHFDPHVKEIVDSSYTLWPDFRRLHIVDEYGGNIEIGLKDPLEKIAGQEKTVTDISSVINEYAGLTIGIRQVVDKASTSYNKENKIKYQTEKIIDAGERMAKCYLLSTTRTKGVGLGSPKTDLKLVAAGIPVCIVTTYQNDYIEIPRYAQPIKGFETEYKISLFHYTMNNDDRNDVWIIRYNSPDYDRENAIKLKLALLRMHSEIEHLKHYLYFAEDLLETIPCGDTRMEPIKKQIKYITRKLLQEERFGLPQNQIVNLAFDVFSQTKPSTINELKRIAGELCDKNLESDITKLTVPPGDYLYYIQIISTLIGTYTHEPEKYKTLSELQQALKDRKPNTISNILRQSKDWISVISDLAGIVQLFL